MVSHQDHNTVIKIKLIKLLLKLKCFCLSLIKSMSHVVNFACCFMRFCFTAFALLLSLASVNFKQICLPTVLYSDGELNVSFSVAALCVLSFFQNLWLKLFFICIFYHILSISGLTIWLLIAKMALKFSYKVTSLVILLLVFMSVMNNSFLSIIKIWSFLQSKLFLTNYLCFSFLWNMPTLCVLHWFVSLFCPAQLFSIFSASSGNISFLPAFDQVISPSLSV